jgi:peptide/nickel transport system permease protein
MVRFIAARVLALVGILWVLATITFFLQAVVPNDPARTMAGPAAGEAAIDNIREEFGFDEPLIEQYSGFMSRLLHGDLSVSVHTQRPVTNDLSTTLPATLDLFLAAFLLTLLIGLIAGLATATARRGTTLIRSTLILGASIPNFCLALIALLVFYARLRWFPSGGRLSSNLAAPVGPTGLLVIDGLIAGRLDVVSDALWHLALPAICLALGPALVLARTLRSSLRSALAQDYARTARAKALPERQVLLKHALRNSLNAPLTLTGLEVGAMLAGIAVVESVFSWPGIGLYTVRAIASSDFPAIIGVTLVIGTVYVVANTLVDLAQVAADPRLRGVEGR